MLYLPFSFFFTKIALLCITIQTKTMRLRI